MTADEQGSKKRVQLWPFGQQQQEKMIYTQTVWCEGGHPLYKL